MIYLNKIKRLFFLLLVIFSFSKMFSNIEIENHDFFNINNPTFGTALITGNWSLGETLTADTSDLNDVDGIGTFEYQWMLDDNKILNATSSTYVLIFSDLKKSISVKIKHTDQLGNIDIMITKPYGAWGNYQYLSEKIKIAQASVVRITASSAVMISPTHAITAAHSPLDENNEVTENLTVQNIFGEIRNV